MSDTGISTTTDAPRYATGQTIQISVAVRNVSAHHCVFGAPGNLSVVDGSGPVFVVHLQCAPSGCPALPPGATSTYPISWNQLGNQPGASYEMPVPSGTYHAQAAFSGGYPVSSSAPFVIGG